MLTLLCCQSKRCCDRKAGTLYQYIMHSADYSWFYILDFCFVDMSYYLAKQMNFLPAGKDKLAGMKLWAAARVNCSINDPHPFPLWGLLHCSQWMNPVVVSKRGASVFLPRFFDVNGFEHRRRILQVLLEVGEGSLSSLQLLHQTS